MSMKKALKFVANLFHKNSLKNLNVVRESIVQLLKKQGIESVVSEEFLEFDYMNLRYKVVFDLEDNYPCCELMMGISDKSYVALNQATKSMAINRYNQDCNDEVKVTASDQFVAFQTAFFFSDQAMLQDLFSSRLTEMDKASSEFITKFVKGELVQSASERRTIGFHSAMYKEAVEPKMAS